MSFSLKNKEINWATTSHQVRKRAFWHVYLMKTHISLRIRAVWSVFIVRMKKFCILGYLKCAQWKFWSDYECAGWSESSLGASVRRNVFWLCDPISSRIRNIIHLWSTHTDLSTIWKEKLWFFFFFFFFFGNTVVWWMVVWWMRRLITIFAGRTSAHIVYANYKTGREHI